MAQSCHVPVKGHEGLEANSVDISITTPTIYRVPHAHVGVPHDVAPKANTSSPSTNSSP